LLRRSTVIVTASASVLLAACGSGPLRDRDATFERPPKVAKAPSSTRPSAPRTTRGGGYYLDDGPGENPPADIDSIPDAVPQIEPLARGAMKPYVVMGQTYTPMSELGPYKARGVASWYGRRYHGKQTSSGEIYDMYAMSAAHPILPIPSYVRVTNVATGKSVVVRVNDRGPFLESRLIDLSYTAAHKLGVLGGGSALVEVESILPDASGPSNTMIASAARSTRTLGQPRPVVTAAAPQAAPVAEPDPILAIAAAARDIEPVGAAPLPQAEAQAPQGPSLAALAKPTAPDAPGVYLQLGAFGSRENAESYLARAKLQVDWIASLLHLYPRDGMFRVHAGPYASSSEARQAAERIAAALGTKPVVVTR
jgi:rare lipoprotein A